MWKRVVIALGVAVLPLLWFSPRFWWLTLVVIGLALLWWLSYFVVKHVFIKRILLILMLVLLSFGSLVSNSLFSLKDGFDRERFFWITYDFTNQVQSRENESFYLPYRLRLLVYGIPTTTNYWITNSLGLVKINNLINCVGLVNIVPMLIGLIILRKHKGAGMLYI